MKKISTAQGVASIFSVLPGVRKATHVWSAPEITGFSRRNGRFHHLRAKAVVFSCDLFCDPAETPMPESCPFL